MGRISQFYNSARPNNNEWKTVNSSVRILKETASLFFNFLSARLSASSSKRKEILVWPVDPPGLGGLEVHQRRLRLRLAGISGRMVAVFEFDQPKRGWFASLCHRRPRSSLQSFEVFLREQLV
jgi:hypothetical protein